MIKQPTFINPPSPDVPCSEITISLPLYALVSRARLLETGRILEFKPQISRQPSSLARYAFTLSPLV